MGVTVVSWLADVPSAVLRIGISLTGGWEWRSILPNISRTAQPNVRGLPKALVRWAILNAPWGKGARTRPDMLIPRGQRYDFAQEKERCLSMIDRVLAKPMDDSWPRSANFPMTGRHWSQLQYKHLDHHLRQFGV